MVALVFVGIMTPKQHCGSIYFILEYSSYSMVRRFGVKKIMMAILAEK